jgi:hypothetical protein
MCNIQTEFSNFVFSFENVFLMVAAMARGEEIGGWYRTEKQVKTLLVNVTVSLTFLSVLCSQLGETGTALE